MARPDAIVVGAGVSGLFAALRLVRAGVRVLLLEQNHQVGGLVAGIVRRGFTFDAGDQSVVDGGMLKASLERWAVQKTADLVRGIFNYRRILVTSGIERYQMAVALAQFDGELRFADPIVHLGLSFLPPPRSIRPTVRLLPRSPRLSGPGPRQLHSAAAFVLPIDWISAIA